MITAVTGIELIAKEFSKHQTCYVNYTRITRETKKKIQLLLKEILPVTFNRLAMLLKSLC